MLVPNAGCCAQLWGQTLCAHPVAEKPHTLYLTHPRKRDLINPLIISPVSAEGAQGRHPNAKPCLRSVPSLRVTLPALHDVLTLAARASRQEKLLALTCDRMIKDLKIQFLKAILKSPMGMGDTDDSENSRGRRGECSSALPSAQTRQAVQAHPLWG